MQINHYFKTRDFTKTRDAFNDCDQIFTINFLFYAFLIIQYENLYFNHQHFNDPQSLQSNHSFNLSSYLKGLIELY